MWMMLGNNKKTACISIGRSLCCWLAIVFCLCSAQGTANAQGRVVPLLLGESLDTHGKQLPVDKNTEQVLRYFERETGLRFAPQLLPWKRAQMMAGNGEGVIFSLSKTPERLKSFQFTAPVATETVWAITYGSKRTGFHSLEDLRGKVVSVGRGFSHGMAFEKARDSVFQVQQDSASELARFKKLVNRRSDLMLWTVWQSPTAEQLETYINQTLVPGFQDAELEGKYFYVSARPLFYDSMHFAVAIGRYQEEFNKLNAAIRRGNQKGDLPKLIAQLF
jgi:polar amino acid transport system substrate-binding protein